MTDEAQALRIVDQLAMRQMADEIERLRDHHARNLGWEIRARKAENEIERLQAHKRAQAEDIMTLGQEIGRLQASLQQYGDHTYECEQKEADGSCTCGYSAALTPPSPAPR